jgi:hypothetical protein
MGKTVTYVHIMGHVVSGKPLIIQNHAWTREDVDGRPVRASWATSVRPFSGRVRKIAKSHYLASCLSACPSTWNNSAPTGRIFMKFDI